MIYLKGYDLIKNDSDIYYNGSKWMSRICGEFTIVGKLNKYILEGIYKKYRYYLCQFKDDTLIIADNSSIRSGRVKNPNFPSVHGIGYIGQGYWMPKINGKATKEYSLWSNMIRRCYSKKSLKSHPTYKNCAVDKRWHSFQNFCKDIQELENYRQWKNNSGWELDKDVKIKGNKIYSKNTCIFVLVKDNVDEMNQRTESSRLTGLIYIGKNPLGKEYEFTNQSKFSREHGLDSSTIIKCLKGSKKTHKGWTFKIKE